ncbi:MAG: DUF58 domain-containing protein [Desulfuromonas sp.]|nr:DUF58 domain-containing protein [Desulfuromonas sp.]
MKPKYRFNLQLKYPPREEFSGDWSGLKKGVGYELWSLRPYESGDSFRHIDWKARARTGNLYVREFARDAAYTLLLICDISPSMRQGGKLEVQRNIAISMAHAAIQENNACGLLLYADGVEHYLSPSASPRQVQRIARQLATVRCGEVRRTRLRPALRFMQQKLPFCLGIILSDFQHNLDELQGVTEAAARQKIPAHELVAIQLLSGAEVNHQGFRGGQLCVEDVESGRQCCIDLNRWRDYDQLQQQHRQQVSQTLDRSGVSSLLIDVSAGDVQKKINNLFVRRVASRR